MKMNLQFIVWLIIFGFGLVGCETAMPEYSDSECGLRILNAGEELAYTFLYDEVGTTEKEVNITVQSVGKVVDYDRSFRIVQTEIDTIGNDTVNAVKGIHYCEIDEELCVIPAGEAVCILPVVLLNDPSLEEHDVVLRLELCENTEFKVNMPDSSRRDIRISNTVVQPSNWNDFEYYLGPWGAEKHRFLIEVTGERWDEEFISNYNYNLWRYYIAKARVELAEENARRQAAGEEVLKEKDGTVVFYPEW